MPLVAPRGRPWNILIVEDDAILRELLGSYMKHDRRFRIACEVATGTEALEAWRRLRPQLIVIELDLAGLSGLALAGRLLAAGCESRLLAMTMRASGHSVAQALAAGFHGFVFKTDSFPELMAAFSSLVQGGTYLSAKARRLHHDYRRESNKRGQLLSPREEQVLRLAAVGRTNQAIAIELGLSVRTVESHRYHLMHKLGLKDTASLVAYAIRQGWSDA